MPRRWPWFILGMVVSVVLVGSCLGGVLALGILSNGRLPRMGEAVAVIPVDGAIVGGEPPSGLTRPANAYADEVTAFIGQADADRRIRAIVLRIDTPGGSAVASDEIYRAVIGVNKPVVVSMGSVAASGGYYIACAADEVFANANTLTGSIGVISILPNVEGLLDKVGIRMHIVESGPHKESGTYQAFTKEDQKIWREIIEETYGNFVQVVAEGRDLSEEQVRQLADGRLYTGRQAVDADLVDKLGNLPEAVARAAELGGIKGEPLIIRYHPAAPLFAGLLSSVPFADYVSMWRSITRRPLAIQYLYIAP